MSLLREPHTVARDARDLLLGQYNPRIPMHGMGRWVMGRGRAVYAAAGDILDHTTWLLAFVERPLSVTPLLKVHLLFSKAKSVCFSMIGVINIDDMSLHEDTIAVYSGGVQEVVLHLRFTLSPPPSIPSTVVSAADDEEGDIGEELQTDFETASKTFQLLADSLPPPEQHGTPQHPFSMLRALQENRLTFHRRVSDVITNPHYPRNFFFLDDGNPVIEQGADCLDVDVAGTSYNVLGDLTRFRHDASTLSRPFVTMQVMEGGVVDMIDFPVKLQGALVRVDFAIAAKDSGSMVAEVTNMIVLCTKLVK